MPSSSSDGTSPVPPCRDSLQRCIDLHMATVNLVRELAAFAGHSPLVTEVLVAKATALDSIRSEHPVAPH